MTDKGMYWWRALGMMFIFRGDPNSGQVRYWMHKLARLILPCDPTWWIHRYKSYRGANDNANEVG